MNWLMGTYSADGALAYQMSFDECIGFMRLSEECALGFLREEMGEHYGCEHDDYQEQTHDGVWRA